MNWRIVKSVSFKETQFDGIFKYIAKIAKYKEIHSKRDIKLSVSSNWSAETKKMVYPLGYGNEDYSNYWTSDGIKDQWYQIDFRRMKVSIDSYDYKAYSYDFFSEWRLLGSNDEYTWKAIDISKTASYPAKDSFESKHIICNQNVKEAFSYIRLQVSGNRNRGDLYFAIYGLEFYGRVYLYNQVSARCIRKHPCMYLINILILQL